MRETGGRPPGEPRTVAWFHCFAGIAGDMALGSLLDAGADEAEVVAMLDRLPIGGWKLAVEPTLRGGIACTRAVVHVDEPASGNGGTAVTARSHADLVAAVKEAALPPRVEARALATFAALAQAEGRLHRTDAADVHFHEVGGHDTIIDVVGTAAALEVLGVDRVASSAVATGTGTVRTAHGLLPNPSPAVVRLLRGATTWGRDVNVELTTPTGAALLAAMAVSFGPMPPMRIEASGFGAGRAELDDLPNCTQVVLGELLPAATAPGQPVVLLEANLDDATGETLAHAVAELLAAGAHDAWVTPVLMKKGRPGHTVSVLADVALAPSLRQVLQHETGTLGVRGSAIERWPSTRTMEEVDVEGLPVRVKVSPGRVKAEARDGARVARSRGLPLREVLFRAEAAWRQRTAEDPPDAPA